MTIGVVLLAGIWLLPAVLAVPAKFIDNGSRWKWLVILILTTWVGWVIFAMRAPSIARERD